jgi:hypothetical protein
MKSHSKPTKAQRVCGAVNAFIYFKKDDNFHVQRED